MSERPFILTVDTNKRNQELLGIFLTKNDLQVMPATTLSEVDRLLESPENIGLALVDIGGFDRSIWERCEGLRHHGIPFLVLSPRQSAAIQQFSMVHGAHGVYVKPLAVKELLVVIRSLMGEE